jgi:hypothetical protein
VTIGLHNSKTGVGRERTNQYQLGQLVRVDSCRDSWRTGLERRRVSRPDRKKGACLFMSKWTSRTTGAELMRSRPTRVLELSTVNGDGWKPRRRRESLDDTGNEVREMTSSLRTSKFEQFTPRLRQRRLLRSRRRRRPPVRTENPAQVLLASLHISFSCTTITTRVLQRR